MVLRNETFKILSIADIERSRRGSTVGDDLSVFNGGRGSDILSLTSSSAFCIKAFCYMIVRAGKCRVEVDQVEYEIGRGDLFSQSPFHNVVFLEVSDDFRFTVLAVTKELIDKLPLINLHPRIAHGMLLHGSPIIHLDATEANLLMDSMANVARQVECTGHRYRIELVDNALGRFFLEYDAALLDRHGDDDGHPDGQRRQTEIKERFIALIEKNLSLSMSVAECSAALHITPQYLNRVVRQQTGMSPSTLISEMIYAEARNLLALGQLQIQDIAFRLGFADRSAFGKFFRRCSGMSATDFRKAYSAGR